jgi:hypothetical protein
MEKAWINLLEIQLEFLIPNKNYIFFNSTINNWIHVIFKLTLLPYNKYIKISSYHKNIKNI